MTSLVDEVPYDVDYVSFVRYSDNFLRHTPCTNTNITKQRLIIPGSATCKSPNSKYAGMYEIFLPEPYNNDHITFKSFEKDYNKPNASISKIYPDNDGLFLNAADVHTFITKDNKYIIMFHVTKGYNVYDIENDKWLLKSNNTNIRAFDSQCQSLLINDELLILSDSYVLFFYLISNSNRSRKETNHFLSPKLLTQRVVFDMSYDYDEHGICLIDCVKNVMEKNDTYLLKILIFGGFEIDFDKSFHLVNIKIDLNLYFSQYNNNNNDNNHSNDNNWNLLPVADTKWLIVKKTLLDISFISENNINVHLIGENKAKPKAKKLRVSSFGCQTLFNSKNEKIILIIAPSAYDESDDSDILIDHDDENKQKNESDYDDKDASSIGRSSVLEYNTVNQTVILHENVCF